MLNFEKYIAEMEGRRAREKRSATNAEIAKGLRERTHEEAVAALYASLTFVGRVSDVLTPIGKESVRALQI